jgi:hypothetical protein
MNCTKFFSNLGEGKMNCPFCQRKIPEDSNFCNLCGKKLHEEISQNPLPVVIEPLNRPVEKEEWGIHLNQSKFSNARNYPSWAKPIQRESWNSRGIIIWDKKTEKVTKLWAYQGIQLLRVFRETIEWKENGVVVGEPAVEILLDSGRKKKKEQSQPQENRWVLTNQIQLSGNQSQEFFLFLEKNEELLQKMEIEDDNERSRILGEVYSYILSWGKEKKDKNETS